MSEKSKIVQLLSVCIVIFVLVPFAVGTEPTLPPYHQYSVAGILERPAGGSRKDFAVVVLGKFQADTSFQTLRGVPYPKIGDIPVGLTDSTGAFFIRISSDRKADSLRLLVIVPDRPTTEGDRFFVDDSRPIKNTETYTIQGEPGCSGCATESSTEHRVIFYSYYFDDKSIVISF